MRRILLSMKPYGWEIVKSQEKYTNIENGLCMRRLKHIYTLADHFQEFLESSQWEKE